MIAIARVDWATLVLAIEGDSDGRSEWMLDNEAGLRALAAAARAGRGHTFVGGYDIDQSQPNTCQICNRPHADHD